jgi:hypothetical protein
MLSQSTAETGEGHKEVTDRVCSGEIWFLHRLYGPGNDQRVVATIFESQRCLRSTPLEPSKCHPDTLYNSDGTQRNSASIAKRVSVVLAGKKKYLPIITSIYPYTPVVQTAFSICIEEPSLEGLTYFSTNLNCRLGTQRCLAPNRKSMELFLNTTQG